jgi:hypothetical protein
MMGVPVRLIEREAPKLLMGLLRWHGCMLRELPSRELLYRSYRLWSMLKYHQEINGTGNMAKCGT